MQPKTLCGRVIPETAPLHEATWDPGEKTCESCLRIANRRAFPAAPTWRELRSWHIQEWGR